MTDMNEIQRYLAEEHVEDFNDGLISRRELIRRVTLITGSGMAAAAFLAACGVGTTGTAPTASPAGASPAASAAAAASGAASPGPQVAYATPPAQATSDGITVRPDDSRIRAGDAQVPAADGAQLIGYLSRPSADGRYPGVLVIHENRGLLEHIKDVTRRLATAGFVAVSIDVLSREGGAARLEQGAYNAALGQRSTADMVKDLQSALDFLKAQPTVDGAKLGVIGFCFGGGMTWHLLNSGSAVRAAVPFYGPGPSDPSGIASTKAAVLAVLAERDSRVNGTMPSVEEQLKKAGVTYELKTYAGVDHAFHNDTGQRYNAERSRQAWVDTVEWLKKHLG
jgi:carboxymethylenebutenolidase